MASTSNPTTTTPHPEDGAGSKKGERKNMKAWLDKSVGSAANLSKLLPTGTTLAFQTLAPSFTKGGECEGHRVNFCFTWGLIAFLTFLSGILSFTDSVTDREGGTYYGYVTCDGLKLFNRKLEELPLFDTDNPEEKKKRLEELNRSKRLKKRDVMHAIFSAAVFVTLALCDASVQRCLVPKEAEQWKDFLANLPLAVGLVAGFLFLIFPSTRNGVGDDGPEPETKKCNSSLMTMDDITEVVAQQTSHEINRVV